MSSHDLENLISLREAPDKTRMYWTLLKAHGLSYLENQMKKRMNAEDSELPNNNHIEFMCKVLYHEDCMFVHGSNYKVPINCRTVE
jgi:hypothetical protein